jgi:hypothetical protein
MPKLKVHYGRPACSIRYEWNGRPSFWGARAGSVVARALRLMEDDRATNVRVRIGGREYDPRDIEITR